MKIQPNTLSDYKKFENKFLHQVYKHDPDAVFAVFEIRDLWLAKYTPLGAARMHKNRNKRNCRYYTYKYIK